MKSRIVALLLAVVLGIGLTGCSQGSVSSLLDSLTDTETEDSEDYSIDPPQCVLDLSEEDDILLNGELKDGVYINRYFGIKFSVPEGGTITRLNDDATDTTEIIPMAKAYEEGWGCLYFDAEFDELDGYLSISIMALNEDSVGLSEEELVQQNIDSLWAVNASFGDEEGPEMRWTTLAGEEHPCSYQGRELENGSSISVSFNIPKGNFQYYIYIFSKNTDLEDLTALFEKI